MKTILHIKVDTVMRVRDRYIPLPGGGSRRLEVTEKEYEAEARLVYRGGDERLECCANLELLSEVEKARAYVCAAPRFVEARVKEPLVRLRDLLPAEETWYPMPKTSGFLKEFSAAYLKKHAGNSESLSGVVIFPDDESRRDGRGFLIINGLDKPVDTSKTSFDARISGLINWPILLPYFLESFAK